jgi:hypothetical protein
VLESSYTGKFGFKPFIPEIRNEACGGTCHATNFLCGQRTSVGKVLSFAMLGELSIHRAHAIKRDTFMFPVFSLQSDALCLGFFVEHIA